LKKSFSTNYIAKRKIFKENNSGPAIKRTEMEILITKILNHFNAISQSERNIKINLNVKESNSINQDMIQLSKICMAFLNENWDQVVKEAGRLYKLKKNANNEADRNLLIEVAKYYLDALMKQENNET
jgi:hypothetical protein